MKICHLTVAHGRYDARILKRECYSLKKVGHEVILLCADNKPDEVLNGVRIVSWGKKTLSKFQRAKLLLFPRRLAKDALKQNADIYQFHDLELIVLGLYLKKRGKKVIFDAHENWEAYITEINFLPKFLSKILSKRLTFFYKKHLNDFDAIFTVSPNMVSNLKQYSDQVYFVPNYPIINHLHEISQQKDQTFIYAGTVYEMSNQKQILQALTRVPAAKYTIVGKINPELKKQLQTMPASKRVTFIDWVSKTDLDQYYSKALAGLVVFDYVGICCYTEGQLGSNKIFEYMDMGLPVICTDFRLWKELIIDKYHCGICVPPGDSKAIAQAMQYIIDHKDEAYQMGKNGQKAISEEFNWGKYEKEFLLRYND
ncbi:MULTISPECIES: glycosyltransferase [Porphyromonadaceae]|uniref:Uncharacterized protein n=1 Tax=Sanguibacteroides justesenii TaxID=1547597 RepID=A0A0C3NKC4_9PORP|nr:MULTISPECIES: glycosyltransferase [Porphyromonadaceae]KIO46672.1 hypothetical protein BA92_02070 [Sanguibacteroides justesenii]PXZ43564.1 glycosyltransferase [Sanguibacteroides justesenii]